MTANQPPGVGKLCPLLTMTEPNQRNAGCVDEDCAWWNSQMGACSIKALGEMATYWILNDSRDRMTPEERALLRPLEATNAHS